MITIQIDDGPDEDGLYSVRIRDHLIADDIHMKVPEDRTFGEMLRRAREAYRRGRPRQ